MPMLPREFIRTTTLPANLPVLCLIADDHREGREPPLPAPIRRFRLALQAKPAIAVCGKRILQLHIENAAFPFDDGFVGKVLGRAAVVSLDRPIAQVALCVIA